VLIKDAWLALQNSLHDESYKQGTVCKACLVQGRLQHWLERNKVFIGNPIDAS
jgi:Zn ribbon nucleic-acid-binding protein